VREEGRLRINMDETTMGVGPFIKSKRKNSILKRNLEIKIQTLKYGVSKTVTTTG
jgi:hypothetical protein